MTTLSTRSILLLVVCILIPLITGVVGSFFTAASVSGWYVTLSKPWFNPPGWVFGPAWTILYILMGISLWMVIRSGVQEQQVRLGIIVFGIQLFVNLFWSVIFFGMQSPIGGLVCILVLLSLIVTMIGVFWKISTRAAYLLVPYLCWTTFATLLNAMIVILN